MKEIILSSLSKTWIFDLDGTILKHNGYILDGVDSFLPGTIAFLKSIPDADMVIFLTSRKEKYREKTIDFLEKHEIRYNHIIFEAPYGERILINDKKRSGLMTAVSVNVERDRFNVPCFSVDDSI